MTAEEAKEYGMIDFVMTKKPGFDAAGGMTPIAGKE